MSPYERMAEQYRLKPQERSFEWYCEWHLRHGFLFSTPEFFIMGRAIVKFWNHGVLQWKLDQFESFPESQCDAWYIFAMSGDMNKAWSILPWELPWVAFERLGEGRPELTFVQFDRLKRLTMQTTQEAVI